MPRIQLKGTVYPTVIPISVGPLRRTLQNAGLGLQISITTTIKDNVVTVDCDLNKFEQQSHLATVLLAVHRTARIPVDLISFRIGHGLQLVLQKFTNISGEETDLVAANVDLAEVATALQTHADMTKVLELAFNDFPLAMALRDMVETITYFDRALINSARAMDTIRAVFMPPNAQSKEDGWSPMREALRVSEDYLKSITLPSQGPRHGDYAASQDGSHHIVAKAWTVLNRFIEYRKRGNQPLPESHPLLT